MKPLLSLLVIGAMLGTPAVHAQSISIDQAPVALAKTAASAATAPSGNIAMKHELSLNWARVTASRDANGKLVAQCTVEPNPVFVAARTRTARHTTTQRKR